MTARATGIPSRVTGSAASNFIDEARLGDLDKIPDDLRDNPGRNTYFFLPLLLGIAGIDLAVQERQERFLACSGFLYNDGSGNNILSEPVSESAQGT